MDHLFICRSATHIHPPNSTRTHPNKPNRQTHLSFSAAGRMLLLRSELPRGSKMSKSSWRSETLAQPGASDNKASSGAVGRARIVDRVTPVGAAPVGTDAPVWGGPGCCGVNWVSELHARSREHVPGANENAGSDSAGDRHQLGRHPVT